MNKKRYIYLDALKILASIGVVFIHVSAIGWDTLPVTSFKWKVMNVYDSLFRWSVPAFMMATGALVLNKKQNTLKTYIKYIKKIIIILIVWSIIFLIPKAIIEYKELNVSYFIDRIIKGHYHF